jgi:hypothetical protein
MELLLFLPAMTGGFGSMRVRIILLMFGMDLPGRVSLLR